MVHECLCGDIIPIAEELCEQCLAYCAKVLDVDIDTYTFNTTGEPALFEMYRYAWSHSHELQQNRNSLDWDTLNDILTFDERMI